VVRSPDPRAHPLAPRRRVAADPAGGAPCNCL